MAAHGRLVARRDLLLAAWPRRGHLLVRLQRDHRVADLRLGVVVRHLRVVVVLDERVREPVAHAEPAPHVCVCWVAV